MRNSHGVYLMIVRGRRRVLEEAHKKFNLHIIRTKRVFKDGIF